MPSQINRTSLVSVVIPAYNAEQFIGRTLASVLAQTHPHLEVLVVDDGSQDRTPELVEAVARSDSRVRLICQANAGVSAARNRAIACANGEFIAPVDADDLWFPQKIERQLECFAGGPPEVGLVYTWTVMIDEDDNLSGRWCADDSEGNVLLPLIYRNFIGSASVPLIRRRCLDEVGPYNLKLKVGSTQGAEDWDLYLRIAERYEFRVVREFLAGYRQVRGSMSRNYTAMIRFVSMVIDDVRARHPEVPQQLFDWAMGELYLTFSKSCYQVGSHTDALGWLGRAIQADPAYLQRSECYRLLGQVLLGLASRNPATAMRPTRPFPLQELSASARRALESPRNHHRNRLQALTTR